jgi:hypothetical protein
LDAPPPLYGHLSRNALREVFIACCAYQPVRQVHRHHYLYFDNGPRVQAVEEGHAMAIDQQYQDVSGCPTTTTMRYLLVFASSAVILAMANGPARTRTTSDWHRRIAVLLFQRGPLLPQHLPLPHRHPRRRPHHMAAVSLEVPRPLRGVSTCAVRSTRLCPGR